MYITLHYITFKILFFISVFVLSMFLNVTLSIFFTKLDRLGIKLLEIDFEIEITFAFIGT